MKKYLAFILLSLSGSAFSLTHCPGVTIESIQTTRDHVHVYAGGHSYWVGAVANNDDHIDRLLSVLLVALSTGVKAEFILTQSGFNCSNPGEVASDMLGVKLVK